MAETPPLKSLKSALKAKEPSAPIKGAPDHDVDFQTVFPGWPRSYFLGILPLASLGAVYHPDGSPSFNYTQDEDVTASTPLPGSVYRPTTPDPMYVSCMPWTAYPYGIPSQEVSRRFLTEGNLLAVPTPRGVVKKTVLDFWKA